MRYVFGVLAIIIVAGGVWYVSSPDSGAPVPAASSAVSPTATVIRTQPPSATPSEATTPKPRATPTPTATAVSDTRTFSSAQVAAHDSRTSCYAIINGAVYDLTSYIDRHPGGPQRILSICGKDGSSLFGDQHSGQPKPETLLASFKIGTLAP